MVSTVATVGIGALVVIASLVRIFRIGKRVNGMPPGPPTIPLLGNAHLFPRKNAYLQFTRWAKEMGGIYSLMIGSMPMVIITNPRLVRELIDKRGGSASDRPPTYMIDLVTDGKYLTFARYSPDWRRARTMVQKSLTKEALVHFHPIITAEATQLALDFATSPENFFRHTERYSYSVATSILAGTRSPRSTSPLLRDFTKLMEEWSAILEPGAQPPVDLFPILKYVPGRWAKWKGTCKKIKAQQKELYEGFVDMSERRIKNNLRNGSFLESVVDDPKLGSDRVLIRGTIGAYLEGGTDTTALFLKSCILMLTSAPHVQKKAQQEIDAVIGTDRMPAISDWQDLPYVQAIVKEVLRIRPMVPTGVPHYTTQEEVIDGYVIPKGTTVFINLFGILHDEDAYENPFEFNPDRFLQSEFGTKPGYDTTGRTNDTHFGGGRRVCVGLNLASLSMWINTMIFLWGFNFDAPIDPVTKQRVPVDINNYSEGIASAPLPFKADITVRSQKHADIIRKDFKEARPVFEKYERELSEEDRAYILSQQ